MVPTAKELFDSKFKSTGGLISIEDIQEYAIEFAKLHVRAANKLHTDKDSKVDVYSTYNIK